MSGSRRNGTRKIGGASAGTGRHAAPRRSFPGRKRARSRAGKAVPAAAIAATLAAGAAAYGIASSAARPGEPQAGPLTAVLASAPAGGALTFAGAPASPAAAPAGGSVPARPLVPARAGGADGLTAAIRSNVAASRQALAAVARNASALHEAALRKAALREAASRAAARKAAAATPAPARAAGTRAPLACDTSRSMLPENVTAIVSFLLAHGYSRNAVAGIAGNIYRESLGNPESVGSGGGGLIGWTPLPSGFVTGNPAADLRTQLAAILTFNQGWAQYIPALDAAPTPAAAASIYVTDFERAGIPAASQREAAAAAVASACGL